MYKTKEECIEALKNNINFQSECFNNFRDDRDIVLTAVSQYSWSLEYASNRLKDDKEVVLAALKAGVDEDGYINKEICLASDRLQKLCEGQSDVVKFLEATIFSEKLQNTLAKKSTTKTSSNSKIKI